MALAQALGSVSEPPVRRVVCCRLMGAVVKCGLLSVDEVRYSFTMHTLSKSSHRRTGRWWPLTTVPLSQVESTLFEQAMGLCQDTDARVRRAMGQQLDAFTRAVK